MANDGSFRIKVIFLIKSTNTSLMIKKIYLSAMLLVCTSLSFSQIGKTRNLGKPSDFAKSINDVSVSLNNNRDASSTYMIPTPSGTSIIGMVNRKTSKDGKIKIVGSGGENGSFNMSVDAFGNVAGLYTSVKDRKAYRYYTNESKDNVVVKEVDITTVLCIDYTPAPEDPANAPLDGSERMAPIPVFESKPGSQYVIYIDLDGEVSTSDWNNGNTINAAARTWTNADIQTLWEVAAQDYITWDVNVTTSRAVYDATPECRRKMCIVTSTTTAYPNSGGVAYIDTFDDCSGNPCWVFNSGAKTAGETVSHEIGHTVGLRHDGITGGATYYSGHPTSSPVWAPIMGSSYGTNVVGHWSIGEYTNANNQENDINMIGTRNGFGARPDDIGNTLGTAGTLTIESNGNVLNTTNRGIINNRTDIDLFKFTTGAVGNLNLTISPFYKNPNLNVQARLLNSSGTVMVTANTTGTTYASMSATLTSNSLPAGTYYIEIDGAANGTNPTVGYSDYCSIGDYYISGTAPLTSNKPVPQFASSSAKVCAGAQITYTDQTSNGVTSWKWTFPGGTPSTSTSQNPVVTYNSAGTYDVKLVSQNANGKDSITKSNYITVTATPATPATTGASRCGTGVVNLSATGTGTLEWYTASTGGSPINTGTTYSPNLSTTTTYYVGATNSPASQKVGPVSNTLNTGGYLTGSDVRGLLFNVLSACQLKTVKVYANTAGSRTIQVMQGVGGTVLHTKTVNIPAGESRVTLDFNLQPGTQYHIKVTGTLVDLYRNTGGAVYPYTIANLISITETDYAATATGYYYYFYDWEVAAAGCSSSRAAVTGTINQNLTPAITGTTSICNGASTTLTATGGTTYSWSNGSTAASITVSPNSTRTYTVTTGTGGCSGSAAATVTVNPIPTPAITGNKTICSGTSTTLTASGGTTYSWSNGATTPSITVSPNNTRTYTVTATASGCSGLTTATVTVNTSPAPAITGTTTICNGSSTTLTATGGGTYSWSNGATTASITVTPANTQTYSVTATAGGCSGTAAKSVTVNSIPTPTITGTTTICSGTSTTLTASGGTTYTWSNGATTASITISPANTQSYTVTATSSSGCSGSTTKSVTVKTTPSTPTITQNGSVLTSSSATGNQWYLNGNPISGATAQNYTVTQNGNYTVVVTTNGCSSAGSAPLNYVSTDITQADNTYFLNIYPNPNDGNFNVAFNVSSKADYKLELRNTLGQIIYQEVLSDFTGTYLKQMNIAADYGKGIYLISLSNPESETLKKVIVY